MVQDLYHATTQSKQNHIFMRPATKERSLSFRNSPQMPRKRNQSTRNLSYSKSVESLGSKKLYLQQEALKVSTTSSRALSLNKSMDAASSYGPRVEDNKTKKTKETPG